MFGLVCRAANLNSQNFILISIFRRVGGKCD